MNKRYMDFAPRKTSAPKKQVEKPIAKPVARPAMKPVAKKPETPRRTTKLGEIEVLRKVETKQKPSEKPGAKGIKIKPAGETFKMPKPRFINQDKIKKRPLSKNVYKKKVVAPKEEPKGPVTIITKPDKPAHVSLIIAIILTIILGAAAGTVAFLLLPK